MVRHPVSPGWLVAGLLLLSACAGGERAATTANPETTTMAATSERGEMEMVKPATAGATATATPAEPAISTAATATAAATATEITAITGQTFGAPLSAGTPIVTAAALLGDWQKYQGQTLIVEGDVIEVCQNKGCWMTFVDGDRTMRIRFKDYAFFVPKDCSGKTARIEGVFEMKEVPVDEARHYLEDAGKPEEAARITAPVPSYTFMASGVVIEP